MKRLPASFYDRPVLEVAHALIGCRLKVGECSGIIVETEAYHELEPACHAFNGPTPRSRPLFGEPGTAYVYFSYGMHTLFNAVAEPAGVGAAVLIRAIEPESGIDAMTRRRKQLKSEQLGSGPAKLTQALGIELSQNETSLVDGPIAIHGPSPNDHEIATTPRIGISKATDLNWRYCLLGSRHVSAPRPRLNA